MEGVDYAFDQPSIKGLATLGKRFACRYVGMGSTSKRLTPAEARELTWHNIAIVANVEGVADGLLGGFDAGAAWARAAHAEAIGCGMPADRPIYLSVDFDCTATQWPRVAAALRGAGEVLGPRRVGVYGGYDTVRWARRDNVARWFWQTFAWSEQKWAAGNHIEQYRNHVSLVGGTVDLNRSKAPDFGQWVVGQAGDLGGGTGDDTMDIYDLHKLLNSIVNADLPVERQVRDMIMGGVHVPGAGMGLLARLESKVEELGTTGTDVGPLRSIMEEVRTAVESLAASPMVDAVQVAAAIAARPEIARTLAIQVAEQLATINGEITLSGTLNGGIRPPTT